MNVEFRGNLRGALLVMLLISTLISVSGCVSTKGVEGMKNTDEPIIIEETFNRKPQKIWEAITDPNQMNQWLFEPIRKFEPKVGFETVFVVEVEGTKYPHRWKVTEAKTNEKVQLRWKYDGFAGAAIVTFELSEKSGGATLLKLTHKVIEDFADKDIFSRKTGEEGWSFLIKESLKKHLEKNI